MLGNLGDVVSKNRNRFPRNDPTNHIQKVLEVWPNVFRSVLDLFRLVENPDISQLKLFSFFTVTVQKLSHLSNTTINFKV